MNFNQTMDFINSFSKGGKRIIDLTRILSLMEKLDNPHKKLKYIHVAGTNGKGSVCQMFNEILILQGYKTGLYTSPFIVEYRDRIKINGKMIEKEILCEITLAVKSEWEKLPDKEDFSQFEISTAIAFSYFAKEKCDFVISETGIGGLLDSTNIVKAPVLSVITSISLDHTFVLGSTLKEIALQKGGIIKESRPCVLSCFNEKEVEEVIFSIGKEKNSKVIIPNTDEIKVIFESVNGNDFYYKGEKFATKMSGRHQIINALTVIEGVEILRENGVIISAENMQKGIENASVPSRLEVVKNNPTIILDGAHNVSAMKSLASHLNKYSQNKILMIGMMKDKDVKNSIEEIVNSVDEIFVVDDFIENAISKNDLKEMFFQAGKIANTAENSLETLEKIILSAKKDDVIIVCGSLYLTSHLRKYFN